MALTLRGHLRCSGTLLRASSRPHELPPAVR